MNNDDKSKISVEEKWDKGFCENCEEYSPIYQIRIKGVCVCELCKECLLKLYDAIVRR